MSFKALNRRTVTNHEMEWVWQKENKDHVKTTANRYHGPKKQKNIYIRRNYCRTEVLTQDLQSTNY
jgi:hypothetical protein